MSQIDSATSGVHDFDFLVGHWQVHHRKLKKRLANSHEWIEFEGTLSSQPLMGGLQQCRRPRARSAGRSLSWRSAAILRLEDPAVVNLVARQSDATGNRLTRQMRARHGRPIGCRTSREYTNRRERRSQVASHLPSKTWPAGQDSNLHAVNKSTWRLFPDHGPYVQNLIDNSPKPVSGRLSIGLPEARLCTRCRRNTRRLTRRSRH